MACKALLDLESGDYELCRIGEPLQVDSQFLSQLKDLGLLPGSRVSVTRNGEGWFIAASGSTEGLIVDNHVAQHLFLGKRTTLAILLGGSSKELSEDSF